MLTEPDMKLHGLRISVSNHNSATRIQKDAEDPSLNPSESDISTSSDEDAAIPVDTSRKSNTAGIINNNSDSDVAPDFQTSNLTPGTQFRLLINVLIKSYSYLFHHIVSILFFYS